MYGGGKIVLYLIRDKPSYYGTLIESRSECLPPIAPYVLRVIITNFVVLGQTIWAWLWKSARKF